MIGTVSKTQFMELVRENLEEAKEINRRTGVSGTFICASCLRAHSRVAAIKQGPSGHVLCEECYLTWAEMRYEREDCLAFGDLIPKGGHQ